jgi:hypothetical protein
MSTVRRPLSWSLIAATVVCAALFVVSGRTRGTKPSVSSAIKRDSHTLNKIGEEQPTVTNKQRIEGEIVGLTSHGFEPSSITRPTGTFLLVIENDSGLEAVTVLLSPGVGAPLVNTRVPREQRTWSTIVDLPPGTYRLTEPTHSDWVCTLTIR